MRPRVFIGSSTEGLGIANAVQQNLDHDADCTVWTQGVFSVSTYTLDSLINAVRLNDFSIFVFSPDDVTQIRQNQVIAARDNVILEAGLFIGHYGKDRNFIIAPRDVPDFRIPTDLLGITLAEYDPTRVLNNPQAAVGVACTSIKTAILSHPVMSTKLTFAIGVNRDNSAYPLKLTIRLRNTTNFPVLVTSKFFKANKSLRAAGNATGNPARKEYEIKFSPPGGSYLDQFTTLIHPNGATSTWMPLDPAHTDQEVNRAIASASSGDWYYTCDWLGSNGWHRDYIEHM